MCFFIIVRQTKGVISSNRYAIPNHEYMLLHLVLEWWMFVFVYLFCLWIMFLQNKIFVEMMILFCFCKNFLLLCKWSMMKKIKSEKFFNNSNKFSFSSQIGSVKQIGFFFFLSSILWLTHSKKNFFGLFLSRVGSMNNRKKEKKKKALECSPRNIVWWCLLKSLLKRSVYLKK